LREFIYKRGSEIVSFESKNIHTALKYLKDINKIPCQIITKIKDKFINPYTNLEEVKENTLVLNVGSSGDFISKKRILNEEK